MKLSILLIALALASCTTTTTTAPDGTVIQVKSLDKDALATAQATAFLLAERNSGK